MAELKPIGLTPKAAFVETAGRPRTLVAPRRNRVRSGADQSAVYLKLMLFGDNGHGKTYTVKALLEAGYKVLVVTTDLGGSGLAAITVPLRREAKSALLENLRSIELNGYQEVDDFLHEPAAFFPDIYEWDPDIMMWDGFSHFQGVDLNEYVGNMPSLSADANKSLSAPVESGLFLNTPQWNMVKNGTVRALDRFLNLHNKQSGKVIHKLVTCVEGLKAKDDGKGGFLETKEPMLSGAASRMVNAGFDLVIRCKKRTKEGKDTFVYQIRNELARSKNRGFELEAEEPGDFAALWRKLKTQAGVTDGAIDPDHITPVTVAQ